MKNELEEGNRLGYLLDFIRISQIGFARPDTGKLNSGSNSWRTTGTEKQSEERKGDTSCNQTGIVRDSKTLKPYAEAAAKKFAELMEFDHLVVQDLDNRNQRWD